MDFFSLIAAEDAGCLEDVLATWKGGSRALVPNINAVSRAGRTPLMLAAQRSSPRLVNWLLDLGADPNVCTRDEKSALHFAASSSKSDTAVALLVYGARADAVDSEGTTPLSISCQYGGASLTSMLLSHGANACRLSDGRSPLELCTWYGRHAAAPALVAWGACVSECNARHLATNLPTYLTAVAEAAWERRMRAVAWWFHMAHAG